MGAFTLHITNTITDLDEFTANHDVTEAALADSDVAHVHTAYVSEDGTKAYFVDEHESTDTLTAFMDVVMPATEGLPPGREVDHYVVIGDPDEAALDIIRGMPLEGTVYRPLGG